MCGQVGLILGQKQRSRKELGYFKKLFAFLLLVNEQRGPHATGVAWLKQDGQSRILKSPQIASEFVTKRAFRDLLASINSNVTWLAGHTRWQTVGDASDNLNNHPIRAGEVIGTHNGTIMNADALFARFDLPRSAEVDSEIIFRFADSNLVNGQIDIPTFKQRLALCRGGVTAVMAARSNPKEVIIAKENRPLGIHYNVARQVVVYSSDGRYSQNVLAERNGWKPVDIRPMTIAVLECDYLDTSTCEPFELTSMM